MPTRSEDTELFAFRFRDQGQDFYRSVSHPGTDRIVLRPDGQGPMGWYDRIHVYRSEPPGHDVYPAHHCLNWTYLENPEGLEDTPESDQ